MTFMYHTTSFCHVCYREVQAEIHTRDDDSVWISKECPEHGHHEFLVEKDASFWNNTLSKSSAAYNAYNNTMMIEVTDRCNVKCEHCYHQPDNSIPDKPIEWVIAKALRVSQPIIQLIGAEPTLRDDLPEICKILKQNGKIPTTYSNGVRLKDKDYLLKLYNSGLASLSLSIHDPTYHNKNVWNNVKECIDNIHKLTESGIIPTNFLGQVSFNIREEKNVSEALDKIIEFNKIGIKCIYMFRSPAEVGWEFYQKEEVFVSTLFKWIETECKNRDLDFSINQEYGNSPYKIVVNIGTIRIGLVHWPSVKTIDMKWTSIGPYASFIDGTFGNLMIQTIQKEGMKKGWWLGHRIISNN